jgi:hypothetical protein
MTNSTKEDAMGFGHIDRDKYNFKRQTARMFMSGQAQTVILHGNVGDQFYINAELAGESEHPHGDYVNMLDYLRRQWSGSKSTILLVYEINGAIQFVRPGDEEIIKQAWIKHRTKQIYEHAIEVEDEEKAGKAGETAKSDYHSLMYKAVGNPAVALRLLETFCKISRGSSEEDPLHGKDLLILLEDADMIIPEGEITRLSDADRHRTVTCREWFTDPGFMRGKDAVVMLTESASQINSRVSKLPQILRVPVHAPDEEERAHYITWFNRCQPDDRKIKLWGSQRDMAAYSAGLSLHALRQMLVGATYENRKLSKDNVTDYVEIYILSQLGEGTVEFHRPHHTLDDLVGNSAVIRFLREVVIRRMLSTGKSALSGVAVSGPIGAGKTFIFEGLAAELGMPVLILKNLRSKWFGGTDVIMERLERVLYSLSKVAIFVDEADTVFGGVGQDVHATERRLTGKIQSWMSDPRLKGKVIWILMTARVQNLSADIRRPGRVGNLIIPILDPVGADRNAFIDWSLEGHCKLSELTHTEQAIIHGATKGFSAAQFAALREELAAQAELLERELTHQDIVDVLEDQLSADIQTERRIQELYALVNCTRKSLLPGGDKMERSDVDVKKTAWVNEIRELKLQLAA